MDYIRRHWRGELGLVQAFWVNLVGIRLAFLVADRAFQPPFTGLLERLLPLAVGLVALNLLIVYPWQIVGLLRTSDRLVRGSGSMTLAHGVHFAIVASLLLTLFSLYGVFQPLAVERPDQPHWITWEQERASQYAITVNPAGTAIRIRGAFELGLARSLRAALAAHPDVREVILDSDGGFVVQGRAVAGLIEARGLDTRVDGICKSACALAYVAGRTRRLGRQGRLGFHQYRHDARTAHPSIDLPEEHRKDRDHLIRHGIDPNFATRAFQASPDKIWTPGIDALLAAGVVHEMME